MAKTNSTAGPAPVRFRHLLVPTDLTARTMEALELARTLASSHDARVTLLHVIQTIPGVESDELQGFYQRLERKARKAMSRLAGSAAPTASVQHAIAYGRRAEEIVGFAQANAVDLIVLASHRVTPSMENRDWGTISYKVGILARCPVLLVK